MPKKIFTEEEKEEIIRLYTIEKMGAKPLGQKFGCSAPTLLKNLSEWGIKPNAKKLDLTNQHFGELTAIKPATSRNDRYTRWVCKCSCGKEVEVRTDYLTSSHTTSCGHIKEKFFSKNDDIIPGKKFGKLSAIKYVPGGKWKCLCDCGNETIVETSNLTNGNTQSCGCLKSKGELKINKILLELNIDFKTQYSFNDCRFIDTNRLAYFDYALFKEGRLLGLIEYDGSQHQFGWGYNKENLNKIQEKDNYKNEYCLKNNIKLMRISYEDYEKLNKNYLLQLISQMEEAQDESLEI